MNILVTGAAGFIGSHLCEKLLENKNIHVVGIDTFIGPTKATFKKRNIEKLLDHPRFQLIQENLLTVNLNELLRDIDVIYHLAGMPGVRSSWGKDFDPYVTNNIQATQRLLEAAKETTIEKFIYASTSSIYGEKIGKVSEARKPTPLSPYGITKLAGEHLCNVYHSSFDIPVVVLRYFSVYGPRQRTDMAFHRFIKQILRSEPISIFGDGEQSRDFTFIQDCVEGTAATLEKDHLIGKTINIGGKEHASVNDVLKLLEQLTGKKARKNYTEALKGEPKHTWADISLAENLLNYHPQISLQEGLAQEIDYIRDMYEDELE